jgi:hypothetical protein
VAAPPPSAATSLAARVASLGDSFDEVEDLSEPASPAADPAFGAQPALASVLGQQRTAAAAAGGFFAAGRPAPPGRLGGARGITAAALAGRPSVPALAPVVVDEFDEFDHSPSTPARDSTLQSFDVTPASPTPARPAALGIISGRPSPGKPLPAAPARSSSGALVPPQVAMLSSSSFDEASPGELTGDGHAVRSSGGAVTAADQDWDASPINPGRAAQQRPAVTGGSLEISEDFDEVEDMGAAPPAVGPFAVRDTSPLAPASGLGARRFSGPGARQGVAGAGTAAAQAQAHALATSGDGLHDSDLEDGRSSPDYDALHRELMGPRGGSAFVDDDVSETLDL